MNDYRIRKSYCYFVLFYMENKKQEEKEVVRRGKPSTDVHKSDLLHQLLR